MRNAFVLLPLFLGAACSSEQDSPLNSAGAGNAASGSAGAPVAGTTGSGGTAGVGGAAGAPVSAGGSGGSVAGSTGVSGAGGSDSGGTGVGAGAGGIAGTSGSGVGGSDAVGGAGSSGAAGSAGAGDGGTVGDGTGGVSPTGGTGTGTISGGTAGAAGGDFGVCNGTAPASAVSIYVVGDSTASVYASDLHPRMGWGQPLQDLFATQCAVVRDMARSGRSSKSFIDEGAWTPIRDGLVSGDIVLIQFGHNDEKTDDPTRYTEPQTTFKQYLTTYIEETRAKQATPILLTPINRNSWSGTTLSNTHGTYPDAMRELAAALSVSLIDMTAITKAYFERIGQTATLDIFLILAAGESPNYPDGVTDNTHLQEAGARKVGELVAYDAYQQRLTLASFLKAVPVAP